MCTTQRWHGSLPTTAIIFGLLFAGIAVFISTPPPPDFFVAAAEVNSSYTQREACYYHHGFRNSPEVPWFKSHEKFQQIEWQASNSAYYGGDGYTAMVELWFHGNPAPNCETLFFRELSIEGNITLRVCMLPEPGFYTRVRLPWLQFLSLYIYSYHIKLFWPEPNWGTLRWRKSTTKFCWSSTKSKCRRIYAVVARQRMNDAWRRKFLRQSIIPLWSRNF